MSLEAEFDQRVRRPENDLTNEQIVHAVSKIESKIGMIFLENVNLSEVSAEKLMPKKIGWQI